MQNRIQLEDKHGNQPFIDVALKLGPTEHLVTINFKTDTHPDFCVYAGDEICKGKKGKIFFLQIKQFKSVIDLEHFIPEEPGARLVINAELPKGTTLILPKHLKCYMVKQNHQVTLYKGKNPAAANDCFLAAPLDAASIEHKAPIRPVNVKDNNKKAVLDLMKQVRNKIDLYLGNKNPIYYEHQNHIIIEYPFDSNKNLSRLQHIVGNFHSKKQLLTLWGLENNFRQNVKSVDKTREDIDTLVASLNNMMFLSSSAELKHFLTVIVADLKQVDYLLENFHAPISVKLPEPTQPQKKPESALFLKLRAAVASNESEHKQKVKADELIESRKFTRAKNKERYHKKREEKLSESKLESKLSHEKQKKKNKSQFAKLLSSSLNASSDEKQGAAPQMKTPPPMKDTVRAAKLNNRGFDLYEQSMYGAALQYFKSSIKIDPKNIFGLSNLGLTYAALGKHKKALKYYEKALLLCPNDVETLNNKANSLDELGYYQLACDEYKKSLEIQPNNADTLTNYADTLENLGDEKEALKQYKKSLAINANDEITRTNYNNLLKKLGTNGTPIPMNATLFGQSNIAHKKQNHAKQAPEVSQIKSNR